MTELTTQLKRIIEVEHADGCCMADDRLIEPAIRRWRSYARRNKRNKNPSSDHLALDIKKGWLQRWETMFGHPHSYDELCLEHLAKSFAEALTADCGDDASQ